MIKCLSDRASPTDLRLCSCLQTAVCPAHDQNTNHIVFLEVEGVEQVSVWETRRA